MSEIGKKRGAQGDLSRENCESIVGEEKNDVDLSGGGNGEGWQKAAPEVIQERRILKPTLPGMMSSPAAEMTKPIGFLAYKTNPFAALGATGASSFPTASPSPSSPKPNPFSSQNPPHNPFMSFDHSKGFEFWGGKKPLPASTESTLLFSTPSAQTPPLPSAHVPKESDCSHLERREEQEQESIDENPATGEEGELEQPPEEAGDNQLYEQEEEEDGVEDDLVSPHNSVSNGELGEECLLRLRVKLFRFRVTEAKSEWVEMGAGPLKLLRPSSSEPISPSRIVMRRENDRRGSGTKLLVNILLSATATTGRQAEKAVRLTCFTEAVTEVEPTENINGTEEAAGPKPAVVVPTSYLFKTESLETTDTLLSAIEKELQRCKFSETLPQPALEAAAPSATNPEENIPASPTAVAAAAES